MKPEKPKQPRNLMEIAQENQLMALEQKVKDLLDGGKNNVVPHENVMAAHYCVKQYVERTDRMPDIGRMVADELVRMQKYTEAIEIVPEQVAKEILGGVIVRMQNEGRYGMVYNVLDALKQAGYNEVLI